MGNQISGVKKNKIPEYKLVLFGTGECGKSTFFTQVRGLYDPSFEKTIQFFLFRNFIFSNLVELTRCAIVRFYEREGSKFQIEKNEVRLFTLKSV